MVKVLRIIVGYKSSYGFMPVFKDSSFILVLIVEKLWEYFEVFPLNRVKCYQNYRTRSYVDPQL
jgi:hypothetical protein